MTIVCPTCLSCATTRLYGGNRAGCSLCQTFWDEPITNDHANQIQGFNPESPGWKILQEQYENIVLHDMHESATSSCEYPAV